MAGKRRITNSLPKSAGKEKAVDLRVEKTRRSIINTFLALRAKKPLEKVTVKELCQLAQINKSTFYAHYQDLYALSDELETQVVEQVMAGIDRPEDVFEHPDRFTRSLFRAYYAQDTLIQTLFSGSRGGQLIGKLEAGLKQLVFQRRPEYRQDPAMHIVLSYVVYGAYYAFDRNREYGMDQVVEVLGQLSQAVTALFPPPQGEQAP